MYKVDIIADSVSPLGYRLTTLTATYPRFIHEELLTHKDLSRNSASSRAIPTARLIQMIRDNPAKPAEWGLNRSGMQATEVLNPEQIERAEWLWKRAACYAIDFAEEMAKLNVHKQCVNRILQPYMWMTTVITSTQWDHFFSLRDHPAADPTFQKIARMIREAREASVPKNVAGGEWHLPYVTDNERGLPISVQQKLSAARCARVSFLKPGESHANEYEVAIKMAESGHWSPFEHQAAALNTEQFNKPQFTGNLKGWKQLRKMFPGEYKPQGRYDRL